MKRGTIKFFFKVAFMSGAIFAFVQLFMALFRSPPLSWATVLGTLAGSAAFGLFAAAAVTSTALKALGGEELRAEDFRWFSVRQRSEVELPLDLFDSLQMVEEALRGQRWVMGTYKDAEHNKVTARSVGSWQNPGGVITVTLAPVGELASATTRAMIESRRRGLIVGTTRANVQGIALALNQAVNKRLAAQREAAENASTQAQLHQARLSLLQAQVEPHFLYNTLAHLQLLIRSDPSAADEMAGDLIRYLRLSMPEFRGAGFTLGRELELVQAYLNIMKIRLRDRLDIHVELDEEAARLPFPPLLLHTLVENSIKHGIEPRPAGGKISIRVERMRNGEETLKITVADTGIGLQSDLQGSGVGLANLRERLDLLYKGRARFKVAENSPSGVVCTLEIPCAEPRPT